MILKLSQIFFIFLFTLGCIQAQTADTTMAVNFQVTTSSPGGNFSPKNIGAIWMNCRNIDRPYA